MTIELEVYGALPCCTKTFKINGIEADQKWFVNNFDNGEGEEIEYGCNNRITEFLSVEDVKKQLPPSLVLTNEEITKVQTLLKEQLVSGGCGWCV